MTEGESRETPERTGEIAEQYGLVSRILESVLLYDESPDDLSDALDYDTDPKNIRNNLLTAFQRGRNSIIDTINDDNLKFSHVSDYSISISDINNLQDKIDDNSKEKILDFLKDRLIQKLDAYSVLNDDIKSEINGIDELTKFQEGNIRNILNSYGINDDIISSFFTGNIRYQDISNYVGIDFNEQLNNLDEDKKSLVDALLYMQLDDGQLYEQIENLINEFRSKKQQINSLFNPSVLGGYFTSSLGFDHPLAVNAYDNLNIKLKQYSTEENSDEQQRYNYFMANLDLAFYYNYIDVASYYAFAEFANNDFSIKNLSENHRKKIYDKMFDEGSVSSILKNNLGIESQASNEYTQSIKDFFDPIKYEVDLNIDGKTYKIKFKSKNIILKGSTGGFEDILNGEFDYELDLDFNNMDDSTKAFLKSLGIKSNTKNTKEDINKILLKLFSSSLINSAVSNFSNNMESGDNGGGDDNNSREDIDTIDNEIHGINDEIKKLSGDQNVEFEEGTVIYGGIEHSSLPGEGYVWLGIKITEINRSNGTFSIELFTNEVDIDIDGNIGKNKYTKYINAEEFKKTILENSAFKTKLLRFKEQAGESNNLKYFYNELLQNKNIDLSNKQYQSTREIWQGVQFNEDEKILENSEGGQIKYASRNIVDYDDKGSQISTTLMFGLEFLDDGVKVSKIGGDFSRKMSYNDFYLFILNKGLEPFTENQKKIFEDQESADGKGKLGMQRFSVANVIQAAKGFKESLSKMMEESDNLRADKLTHTIVGNTLGRLSPAIGEETFSRLDSRLWNIISSNKDKLSREGGTHDSEIHKIIKDEVFEKSSDSWHFKLKSAGYLLHAVENGGPYYRGLSQYAGKGKRVEAILGKGYKSKFEQEVAQIREKIKTNPTDLDLQNQLIRAELSFISKNADQRIHGSKFATEVDKAMNNYFCDNRVSETKSKFKSTPFMELHKKIVGVNKNFQGPDVVGMLQALSEDVDSADKYPIWFGSMLIPIVSGVALYSIDKSSREAYKKMCGRYGFPLGLFAEDAEGPEKVVKLLDYASKKAGIKPFSEEVGWTKDKIKYDNFSSNFKDIINKSNKWFFNNSKHLLNTFNFKDGNILKDKDLLESNYEELNEEQKRRYDELQPYYQELSEYIEYSLDRDGTLGYDDNLDVADMIQISNGFFHLPKKFINQLRKIRAGKFDDNFGEILWARFNDRIKEIKNYEDPSIFGFVFTKYFSWFGARFYKENKEDVLSIMRKIMDEYKSSNKSKDELKKELRMIITDQWKAEYGNPVGELPQKVEDTLENLEALFINNIVYIMDNYSYDKIRSILEGAFGKENVQNIFDNYDNYKSSYQEKVTEIKRYYRRWNNSGSNQQNLGSAA